MKNFKRILSLVLVTVMLLSFVCINAKPVSAVSTYLDKCTTYASHLSVKTNSVAMLMTYPCTSTTNSASSAKYTIPANTMLTVKSLIKNTANTYWYEVLYYDTTLYIDATVTTMVDHLTGDITAKDIVAPGSLAEGASFGIGGTIASTVNELGSITASMYWGNDLTIDPKLTATDTVSNNTYSLAGSTIDNKMSFNTLDTGIYTYVLSAEVISYYIDDNNALAKSVIPLIVERHRCIITDYTNPNEITGFGVDLSVWNGDVDWADFKDDIDFAFLRASWEYTKDTRFDEYAQGCVDNDIPFGVYVYSYAESVEEAIGEAEAVLRFVKPYDMELPIYFDAEDSCLSSLGGAKIREITQAFIETIQEAGYETGIYTTQSWFNNYYTTSYFNSVAKWLAQIDGYYGGYTNSYNGGVHIWQFDWEGKFSADAASNTDQNYYYDLLPGQTNDTTYRSKCTAYDSHLLVTTTGSTTMMKFPCTSSVDSSSTTVQTVASGTDLVVTALYKNTAGEYWYQVDGGYIPANKATVKEFLYDDIGMYNPDMADNLNEGSYYYIKGFISSQYNSLSKVHAKIYSGEDTSASPAISSNYSPNKKQYSLFYSRIDDGLAFNTLSKGYYTYEISADVKNYYISNGALTSTTENVVVWTKPFTVGSAAITPPATIVCDHNVVTDAAKAPTCTETGLTAGSHCTKCGLVFETQTVIPAKGHSYTATSHAADCKNYELFHYSCSGCGDSYDISADALANWSETKPLGVDESKIESKTQYRYADCTSTSWEQTGTGTIQYVNSWPSGFSTSNSLYSQYNKKSSKVTASETATEKTVIDSDAVQGYLYYHWCYADSYYSVASQSGSYTTFHAYYDTTDPDSYTCDTSDMSYKTSHSTCSNSNWWFVAEVYGQNYSTYKLVKDGKTWTDWSAWSDTAYTAVENSRKVETRTVYRYTGAELGDHVWENGTCSVCGETCKHPSYVNGVCTICGKGEPVVATDYYLFGYINGKDYACEADYANMGQYKFVNGKLTATFTETSYVAVKTAGNANWYMANGYPGNYVTSTTLYNTTTLGTNADKLYVPGGVEVTFTLVNNGNDTFTLSYTAKQPDPVVKPEITLKYPTLSFEGEVFYNVYYTVSNATVDVEDMGLLTWYNRPANTASATYETAEEIIPGAVYNAGADMYMVRSQGVPAKMLGDNMYLRIYAKLSDGTYAYSPVTYYNAKFYASDILANSTNADMKSLVVAMLNYGAAAQVHFNHNANNLMNADLTAAQKALAKDFSSSMISTVVTPDATKTANFKSNGGFSAGYPSVSFDGAFSINFYLTPKKTVGSGMTLYCWDLNTYNSVSTLTEANATNKVTMAPATNPGEYFANYTGIAAKQIDETVFVAGVYTSGGVRYSSPVLCYSLSAYCAEQIANGSATMQDFAKATVVYGDAAKTYFANLNG